VENWSSFGWSYAMEHQLPGPAASITSGSAGNIEQRNPGHKSAPGLICVAEAGQLSVQ
jgi:hypothetical protein